MKFSIVRVRRGYDNSHCARASWRLDGFGFFRFGRFVVQWWTTDAVDKHLRDKT